MRARCWKWLAGTRLIGTVQLRAQDVPHRDGSDRAAPLAVVPPPQTYGRGIAWKPRPSVRRGPRGVGNSAARGVLARRRSGVPRRAQCQDGDVATEVLPCSQISQLVPDWFGMDNVDGGVAVGDLDGDGSTDLVVFVIDSPAGPNGGLYRVGRGFVDGAVTGGWGPWQRVPDWPFWENAGGGIALADLDGSGSLDLVAVRSRRAGGAEHRPGPRGPRPRRRRRARPAAGARGRRCPTGRPGRTRGRTAPSPTSTETARSSWCCSSWTTRPDRTPACTGRPRSAPTGRRAAGVRGRQYRTGSVRENAGAGLAVGDLDGDGTPELLVLVVDSAVGKNDAYYSVGWRLDGRGRPADGWGPWQKVPGWAFDENQGGAVAARRPRRRRHPRPRRARRRQPGRTERRPGPRRAGGRPISPPPPRRASGGSSRWTPGCSPCTPRCCPRATCSSSPDRATTRDAAAAQQYGTRVWHYPAPAMSAPDTPVDLFCCGHAHLPDGRLLAAGGTERYDPFNGLKQSVVFDPAAGPPSPASPTGRVGDVDRRTADGAGPLVPDARRAARRRRARRVRARRGRLPQPRPRALPTATAGRALPSRRPGRCTRTCSCSSTAGCSTAAGSTARTTANGPAIWDPVADTVAQVDGPARTRLPQPVRQRAAAARPGPERDDHRRRRRGHPRRRHRPRRRRSSTSPHRAPVYVPGPLMHHARMHLCATLLPDRTVLVNGGSGMEESHHHVSPHAEIYHPDTNTWRAAAASRVDRLYHSVALLMPDGKVVTAGSNPARKDEELRIEVFWPPYLFAGPRPTLVLARRAGALRRHRRRRCRGPRRSARGEPPAARRHDPLLRQPSSAWSTFRCTSRARTRSSSSYRPRPRWPHLGGTSSWSSTPRASPPRESGSISPDQRCAELCREPPGLLPGGTGDVPRRGTRRRRCG